MWLGNIRVGDMGYCSSSGKLMARMKRSAIRELHTGCCRFTFLARLGALDGDANVRFSARKQFAGKVTSLTKGAVNAEVGIELPDGTVIHAVIIKRGGS